ncbi:MAG: hypothetical protein LQ350_000391 [Teloschistes chrysophthalmus]|nr:MAG: hypothetical protein LQ350_000391 [Niorma chrysophthalma]
MPSPLTTYAIPILGTLITLTWFAALFYGLSAYHQHIIEQEQREEGSEGGKGSEPEEAQEQDEDEESTDDELYMDELMLLKSTSLHKTTLNKIRGEIADTRRVDLDGED